MQEKLPRVFISPMSTEIINAVVAHGQYGFAATRHQVSDDGYTCTDYELLNTGVVCERDHGGPELDKYLLDAFRGYKILHVDVWNSPFYEINLIKTISFIKQISVKYPDVLFEVGTEEKIYKYDSKSLEYLLVRLKWDLGPAMFSKVKFAVIQGGAKVFNCSNIDFNETQFTEMIGVCKKYGVLSKEHNCDFIDKEVMRKRLDMGLDAYNIGPEIVMAQNKAIMQQVDKSINNYFQEYCYNKNEWQRWTDKEELIVPCTLHYYYKELSKKIPKIDMIDIIKGVV